MTVTPVSQKKYIKVPFGASIFSPHEILNPRHIKSKLTLPCLRNNVNIENLPNVSQKAPAPLCLPPFDLMKERRPNIVIN